MLFNGKYYNKPGHLGMTRAELKEALQGGGGSDFSSIRGKFIDIIVTGGVITSVTANGVSITPSDFFTTPYIDILLTLSVVSIVGLTVDGLSGTQVYFSNGTATVNQYGDLAIQGLFTYTTPDGNGLGYGIFSIGEGLAVDFIQDTIFVSP